MPDPDIPAWPESGPGELDPLDSGRQDAAHERRHLLNNVRHLAVRVELISMQQKANDAALNALRAENANAKLQTDQTLQRMDEKLSKNTAITLEISEVLNAVRGGFKVLGWLGRPVIWAGALAAAGLAVFGFFQLLNK